MADQPTILIVDDDKDILNAIRIFLERRGINCLLAHNGEEGLTIYNQNKSSIKTVLTDVRMPPGMSGLKLTSELKRISKDLSVYIMSAEDFRKEATDSGANKFFKKENLIQILEKVINYKPSN